MADTLTPNLGLTQPEVGASSDSWGGKLNANLGILDGKAPFYVPSGGIILWSGAATAIPAGWALCDGTNGAPDLRDRFVIGAGSDYAVGAAGGLAVSNITVAGHALSVAEMPSHAHGVTDPGHSHGVSDPQHAHSLPQNVDTDWDGGTHNDVQPGDGGSKLPMSTNAAATGIGIDAAATGVGIQDAGGGAVHAHGASQDTNLPPYYALCFIMKS